MKKLLIVSVILFSYMQGYAQQVLPKINILLFVGNNASSLGSLQSSQSSAYIFDVMAGGGARVGDRFFAQPEVEYFGFSTRLSVSNPTSTTTTNLHTSSVKVPLLVGARIIKLPLTKVSVHFMLGPEVSVPLSAISDNNNINITKSDLKTYAIDGFFGAGVDVAFLTVDIGYYQTFTKEFRTSNFPGNSKQSGVLATIGVKL